jgi:hypothetical protein
MRLIDIEDGVVVGREPGEMEQGGDVAIHAEEGFGHQKAASGEGTEAAKVPLGDVSVQVGVNGEFGA